MFDITKILSALLLLILSVLTTYLIPLLKQTVDEGKLEKIRFWVRIAVNAAEQIFASGAGSAKKEYVLKFLTEKGFRIDPEELDNLIEATVLELKNSL